jgi:hypothetical protein
VTKNKVSSTPKTTKKASTTTKPKKKTSATAKPEKKVSETPKLEEINVEQEFPHSGFPYKLVHKDGNETRTCYFMNEAHLNKHIERYRLDRRKIKLLCRHDYENPA